MSHATEEIPPAAPPLDPGAPLAERLVAWYRRAFGVAELEASRPLRWFYWATLLGFFLTYYDWLDERSLTRAAAVEGRHRCWPFFQKCGEWYFLAMPPEGYSQPILYMALFALMGGAALWTRSGRWTLAHALMMPLFAWKALVDTVLSMLFLGNYHYFHLSFAFLLLFARHKLFFLRRALVVLYLLAATIKIHEGWVLGTYFTSLRTGMPIFPDATVPLFTNLLILVETVGGMLLLSKDRRWQRGALVTLVLFHLYSGILVRYLYPAMCLPALIILFGPWYETVESPLTRPALVGWGFLTWILGMQSISYLIKGDVKLTLEGNYYGLYMFEANHQCVSTVALHEKGGKVEDRSTESRSARRRCGSYAEWFRLQQLCRKRRVERISWTLDHSINGGPFYRIVDEPDACRLHFAPLTHNPWIRLPEEGAKIVGYPAKNIYDCDPTSPRSPASDTLDDDPQEGDATRVDGDRKQLLVLRGLEGSPPAGELNATQKVLAPHVDAIILFWWIVWFATLGLMLWRTLLRPLLARGCGESARGGDASSAKVEESNAGSDAEPASAREGEPR